MSGKSPRQILEERAQQLAQPVLKLDLDITNERLLVFQRGSAQYALDMRYALEVVNVAAHAPLPGMPDYCLGIAAARGELLALFDLAQLLGEAPSSAPLRCMLLCGETRPEFGLAIDSALSLADSRPLFAAPAPASDLILGVHPDGFAVIDGAALLADPRLMLAQASQESTP